MGGLGVGGETPGFVVEEDAAADDALFAPGADAIGVGMWGVDVGLGDAVVELGGGLVGKVAEAVPLGGGLRIECPDVVVDGPGWFGIPDEG